MLGRFAANTVWQTALRRPATAIHSVIGHKFKGILATYGWRQRYSSAKQDEPDTVTGFFAATAGDLMKLSGQDGIFMELLNKRAQRPEVEWVTEKQGELSNAYLQRALRTTSDAALLFAWKAKLSLAFAYRVVPVPRPLQSHKCSRFKVRLEVGPPRTWKCSSKRKRASRLRLWHPRCAKEAGCSACSLRDKRIASDTV